MLQHTFCHIPGIGPKTEEKLWAAGITRWEDWQTPAPVRLSGTASIDAPELLAQSRQALEEGDPAWFTSKLGGSEPWRIFPHFRYTTAYLDIETTGGSFDAEITAIALYDGKEVRSYVNGRNLDDFVDDVYNYNVLVSYNGRSFDIPFIERHFDIRLEHAQIDLRHVLARLGFRGGLKGCEKQLGLNRGNLDGVDGYYAVLLWREFQATGEEKVLDTLLAYNIEDTVNLERLAVEAYNRHALNTPFGEALRIECPPPPPNPYFADDDTIQALKRSMAARW